MRNKGTNRIVRRAKGHLEVLIEDDSARKTLRWVEVSLAQQ